MRLDILEIGARGDGIAEEEGRRYFGQPRGLKPGLVAKLTRLTPLPAAGSEAKFIKRFNELAQ